jgi:hypothetical protein
VDFRAFHHLNEHARTADAVNVTRVIAEKDTAERGKEPSFDAGRIEAPVTWKAYLICAFASFGGIFFGYDYGSTTEERRSDMIAVLREPRHRQTHRESS